MRPALCNGNNGSDSIIVFARAPRLVATLFAAIVCGQPLTTIAAPVAEAQKTGARAKIGLVVAVDLDQEDSGIETYIYNAATSSLNDANLAVGNDDVDSILTIEIRWVEGTLTDYAVRFRLGPTESVDPNIIHAFECNGCTGPELLEQVAQAVEAVVPPAVATKTSAPDPKPVTSQPDELQTTQPRAASRPEPPVQDQPMVVAGAVTLGLGLSGMVGVVGSLLAGDAYGIPRGRIEWPLFGVASGVALIGASLIGAGVAIDRKRVKLLPGLGSLGLSVRF